MNLRMHDCPIYAVNLIQSTLYVVEDRIIHFPSDDLALQSHVEEWNLLHR